MSRDHDPAVVIAVDRFDAVVFDMDGVITDTAGVHRRAWARLFDGWLGDHAPEGADTSDFTVEDYRRYVDGPHGSTVSSRSW